MTTGLLLIGTLKTHAIFSPHQIGSINHLATKLKQKGRDLNYIEPLFDLSLAADEFHMLNLRLLHRVG